MDVVKPGSQADAPSVEKVNNDYRSRLQEAQQMCTISMEVLPKVAVAQLKMEGASRVTVGV